MGSSTSSCHPRNVSQTRQNEADSGLEVPHVPQTEARWRADGFDALVVPLSPYDEHDAAAVRRAADALRAGGAGLVVMDCIGFKRKTRDEMAHLVGAPVLVANLLVARVAAELLGSGAAAHEKNGEVTA